jgi:chemotaxis protein methyltransferase CheR
MLSSSQNIRIWSAGCAAGEEPYSLAILAEECRISCMKDFHYIIYASDVDRDALAKASKGQYDANSFQGTDKSLIGRYFVRENESFKVKDSLKQYIRFERHDLMTAPLHQNLDLVLCRNVMIYFSRESQQKIHMHFHDSLKEDGYLVIGKTEMLSGEPNEKFICIDPKTRIYRKTKEMVGFMKPEATIILNSHETNLKNTTNKPLLI